MNDKSQDRVKVNIEMPSELLTEFRQKAKEQELTVSALIRLLIKKYLKESGDGN